MPWQVILALVIVIPIILFPAAFVWYLNLGGLYTAVKEILERRAVRAQKRKAAAIEAEWRLSADRVRR